MSKQVAEMERTGPEDRKALFHKCQENIYVLEDYLRGWFLGAALEDIRRENLREFLLWGFFDTRYDPENRNALSILEWEEVEGYINEIEQNLGRPIKEGRGKAICLRLTFDEVYAAYRSLTWYIIIFGVDQYAHFMLSWYGFKHHATKHNSITSTFPPRPQTLLAEHQSPARDLSYWYRPHRANGKKPVVFFHGIGVGLWLYVRFLWQICSSRTGDDSEDVGVIALEILPVSFRITNPPPKKADFILQMTQIVDHHGWQDFAIVSHSYGSTLTTHALLDPNLGPRISSVVQVDPVTIMLHLPDVAYNFTRRQPRSAEEWGLWYFAGTDPGVACCLSRHFGWRDNIIWKEDLLGSPVGNRKVAICLAGKDIIVNTASVSKYLGVGGKSSKGNAAADIDVVFFESLGHAGVFENKASFEQLVQLVRTICIR